MWDQRYGAPGFAFGTAPNDFLAERAERHLPPGGEVLCLAEGEGRNAVFLAERGFVVTGVDRSAVGLEKARKLASERGVHVHTVLADLEEYDLGEERWDGIVSIWCHTPPALRGKLHRAVVRALKPGGVFLLEAYTPEQPRYGTGGPPNPKVLMTLAEVGEELAGLELVVGRETVRDVVEGRYHHGPSAVLQVIAVKPASLTPT